MATNDSLESEAMAPTIFQCEHCRSVVGDTYTFVSADQERQTVSLGTATGCKMAEELEVGDNGGAFRKFTCQCCQEELGRVYVTTSREMDPIRGCFTFDVGKVKSYKLGSAELNMRDLADSQTKSNSSAIDGADAMTAGPELVLVGLDAMKALQIRRDVNRLMEVVLHFQERHLQLTNELDALKLQKRN